MNTKTTLLIITAFIMAAFYGCNTTEPGNDLRELVTLTEIDVAVSEAYIHVKLDSPNPDQQVVLKRDGEEVLSFNAGIKDTIVTDTNLAKSTSYSYSAILTEQTETVGKSNNLVLSTLEPTSHDFTWETHTFGDFQSFLYDVAVVEKTGGTYQIWAVGEVHLEDANGNFDSEPYGLVRWDGNEWKIEKTKFRQYNQTVLRSGIARTIWSFGEDNNYLCSSSSLVQWQDGSITEKAYFLEELPFTGQVSCMWAKDENNIYLGSGRDGSLYHYYGEGWTKLDAGPINGGITDIFGYQSPVDNKWKVFATVTYTYQLSDRKILTIDENNSIDEFPWNNEKRITAVWTNKGLPIYASGDGIKEWKGKEWSEIKGLPGIYSGHISGSRLNNVFAVGDFNLILHYNGETWKNLESNGNGFYSYVYVSDNLVVMAGYKNGRAVVKIGKR